MPWPTHTHTKNCRMSFSTCVVLLSLASAVLAAPQGDSTPIPIVKQSQDGPNPDGSYSWSYETGNGIQAQEQGELVSSADNPKGAMSATGSFSYTADDGTPLSVTYTADENGFHPKGDHLPVAPAIPPAIIKALEWIAAHPEEDNLRK